MKTILNIFILLIGFNAIAQESTIDKIAQKTCEFLQSEEVTSLSGNEKTTKLGVFIINQYNEHKEALILEGIELDFSDENGARAFGEQVGMNMVKFCAEALIALAANDEDDSEVVAEPEYQSFVGEIIGVKGNEFSFIQVKASSGISQKFLWLANFIGSERLISLTSDAVIGTKVKVTYKNTECFSPMLKEYIIRKEIVEIEYLD